MRVYDASGPYTETDSRIDLAKGLPRIREPWIARRDFKPYAGRAIKEEDNGGVAGDKLVPACPANTNPLTGEGAKYVTQYEFARAGIITEEMVYVAPVSYTHLTLPTICSV